MMKLWRWALVAAGVVGFVIGMATTHVEAREIVPFNGQFSAGTIVVSSSQRQLFYVLGNGSAIRYPVAVGKNGKRWSGVAAIREMQRHPYWIPPAEVKRDKPELPDLIPPGPRNPMGTRVMVLDRDQYAIHGTNRPDSIGTFASYGCIRMHNAHIEDLYERVRPGTQVVVLQ